MKKIIVAFLISTLSLQSIALELQVSVLQGVSPDETEQINALIKRNLITGERPASCPLKSVKNFELVSKINNIKSLFNNSCLDKNQERLNNILSGAEDIQSSIDQYNADTQTQQTQVSDNDDNDDSGEISGEQIATVVSGLSNIFQGNSCDSLNEDQSFLAKSSSIISEIAKIGLATNNSNGLIISAGGFALSSILMAIDSLFDKRFDFEKAESRQSFIKLNCAFYDIRRDIHNSGFLDVSTASHKADLAAAIAEKKEVQDTIKKIEAQYTEIQSNYSNESLIKLNLELGKVVALKEKLAKVKKAILDASKLNRLDQLNIINSITWDVTYIQENLVNYQALDLQHIDIFNFQFSELLAQANANNSGSLLALMSSEPKVFFDNFVPNITFHLGRVQSDIESYEARKLASTQKELKVNNESFGDFKIKLNKNKEALLAEAYKLNTSLDQVITRLTRITGADNFVRGDGGAENIVSILDDYDSISKQVYGVHGLNFLDSMVSWSLRENHQFKKQYDRFISDFNLPANGDLSNITLNHYEMKSVCQSALPLRRKWNFAKNLAEQGYDFVATNIDLFSSSKKSNRYLGNLAIIDNKSRRSLSVRDEILYHEKSAYVAKSQIAGNEVPYSAREILLKNRWLGEAMVNIEATQVPAGFIQKVTENFNCLKTLEMD